MHSALKLVTAPTTEPIDIDEAREHLRVDIADDDLYIESLIVVARTWAENFTRRAFITQTWDLQLDCFPRYFELPRAPLQSVVEAAFTYIDGNGSSTQVPTSVYDVDAKSEPGRVYPAYGQVWPTPRAHPAAVNLRFVAGYGDAVSDVPQPIRHALLLLVGQWYEQREPVVIGTISTEVPMTVQSLLYPYQMTVGF